MTNAANILYIVGQLATSVLLVLFLEFVLHRKYEHSGTGLVVAWGVLQVGLISFARLALGPIPDLAPRDLTLWTWWVVGSGFCWASIPVFVWQAALWGGRWLAVLMRTIMRRPPAPPSLDEA